MVALAWISMLLPGKTYAQNQVPQKDISDVYRSIFKSKKAPTVPKDTTVKGIMKPTYSGLPAIGYTLTTDLVVTLSGNAAFRLDTNARISTIASSIAYTEKKQISFPLESNIWTKNNNYNLVGDIHFMIYPQDTYGLGSNSSINNDDKMDYNYIRFYEIVLKKITPEFFAGAGYIIDYHYNVSEDGIPGEVTDYEKYGAMHSTISTGFTLNALYDTRDNPVNPQRGFYASGTFRDNLTALGSTANWQSLILDVRKYVSFPAGSRNIWAFWSYDWLVLGGKPPYLDLPSTNWDTYSSTGRGYIQGRFRGTKMVYLETEYRFPLSANGLFGAVVFLNGESFSSFPGTQLESVQPGFGGGVRVKLNKASRTNLDVDYGFGEQGSRGLFINISELF